MWYLYLIECHDGSLYTGIAVDVHKRFALHAGGKAARYTRAHPPRCLLGFTAYPDRSSASAAEHAFKKLSPAQKRQRATAWA
jgi:putative endonuclease